MCWTGHMHSPRANTALQARLAKRMGLAFRLLELGGKNVHLNLTWQGRHTATGNLKYLAGGFAKNQKICLYFVRQDWFPYVFT